MELGRFVLDGREPCKTRQIYEILKVKLGAAQKFIDEKITKDMVPGKEMVKILLIYEYTWRWWK